MTSYGHDFSGDLGIHYARENLTSADWRWDSRINRWGGWLLWYVAKGAGNIVYPGSSGAAYRVREGSCCLFNMDEHFTGRAEQPLHLHAIGFQPQDTGPLWSPQRRHRRMRQARLLRDCMEAAIAAWDREEWDTAHHWLRSSLILVRGEDAQPVLSGRDQSRARQVTEIAEAMQREPARHWSSNDVVTALGVGREQAIRLFKRYQGFAPGDWLQRCRMEEAMHLLRFSDLQIREIANTVGYQDPYYFSRIFKKPKAVAQRCGGNAPGKRTKGISSSSDRKSTQISRRPSTSPKASVLLLPSVKVKEIGPAIPKGPWSMEAMTELG